MITIALGPDISRANIPNIWGVNSEIDGPPIAFATSRKSYTADWVPVETLSAKIVLNNGDKTFATQEFVITQSNQGLSFQSISSDFNPIIEFVVSELTNEVSVKPKPAGLNSVESEILYTRFYWTLISSNSISLLSNDDEIFFRIDITEDIRSTWESVEYRAKLFRKLAFLEYFFERRFFVPVQLSSQDAMAIEILFRGITEGEFEFPAVKAFRVPLSTVDLESVSNPPFSRPGRWVYKLPVDVETILGVIFPVGPRTITANRATLADPRLLSDVRSGGEPKEVSIKIMDHLVSCRFEKYADSKRLLINNGKLNKFKDLLRQNEPESLVALLDSSLASIPADIAIEMAEGVMQFYDFPDRFILSDPILVGGNWNIKIGLAYSEHEPVWLDEININRNTGHLSLNKSVENLLAEGRKLAREILGVS
jgi:hypothetical protein